MVGFESHFPARRKEQHLTTCLKANCHNTDTSKQFFFFSKQCTLKHNFVANDFMMALFHTVNDLLLEA